MPDAIVNICEEKCQSSKFLKLSMERPAITLSGKSFHFVTLSGMCDCHKIVGID